MSAAQAGTPDKQAVLALAPALQATPAPTTPSPLQGVPMAALVSPQAQLQAPVLAPTVLPVAQVPHGLVSPPSVPFVGAAAPAPAGGGGLPPAAAVDWQDLVPAAAPAAWPGASPLSPSSFLVHHATAPAQAAYSFAAAPPAWPHLAAAAAAPQARQAPASAAQLAAVPELSAVSIPAVTLLTVTSSGLPIQPESASATASILLPQWGGSGPGSRHSLSGGSTGASLSSAMPTAQPNPYGGAHAPGLGPPAFEAGPQLAGVRPPASLLSEGSGGTTCGSASSHMAQLAAAQQHIAAQRSAQAAAATGAAQQASAALLLASSQAAGARQLALQLTAAAQGVEALQGGREGLAAAADQGAASRGWNTGGSSACASSVGSPSQRLAQAAAASRQVVIEQQMQQQTAAAAYHAAASQAAAAGSLREQAQAAMAAQQAAAAYSEAGSTAAAAEQTSCQLQHAAVVTAAAEASPRVVQLKQAAAATKRVALQKQEEQAAAATAYQVAASKAVTALDVASASTAVAAAQDAASAYSVASSEAAAATSATRQLEEQAAAAATEAVAAAATSQRLPGPALEGGAPPQPPQPAADHPATQLAGAAAAAQQMHAVKTAEQQTAAAAYHAAASQAAAAGSLQEQAQAAVAVQRAAAAYTSAANEAAVAAMAAEQLHKAAVAAATVPAAVPASAPLAASIAAGMLLPTLGGPGAAAATLPAFPHGALAVGSSSSSPPASQRPPGSTAVPAHVVGQSPARAVAAALAQPALFSQVQVAALPAAAEAPDPAAAPGLAPGAALLPGAVAAAHQVHWAPSLSRHSSPASQPAAAAATAAAGSRLSPSHTSFRSISAWSARDAAGAARTCKLVCSSGGSFVAGANGAWDYEGGDTRLVATPFHCDLQALVEALQRATAPMGGPSGGADDSASDAAPRSFAPQIKYRLPSDPGVWVDLLDDDDVALMFDEYDEHRSGAAPPSKLHLFVQWRSPQDVSLGECEGFGTGGSHAAAEPTSEPPRAHRSATEGLDSERQPDGGPQLPRIAHSSLRASRSPKRASWGRSGRGESVDLGALVDKMEVIEPSDIHLIRFLGSGGYGDVYLGRWHGVDVAVKCLSPSLFFGGGEFSSVNRGAILDLIKEADLLGSMRHPNVVWVYGLVLPRLALEEAAQAQARGYASDASGGEEDSSRDASPASGLHIGLGERGTVRTRNDVVDAIASGMRRSGLTPGMVRPPAMVAEFMAGGSLKSALARKADIVGGALTRVVLALDAAKGMEYLHSKSLVHFDLKSANLLLGYRDRRPLCKVADFGLSKQRVQTFVSGVSSQRGTLPWTAPEILRTPDAVTEKIDVFSFGIVMWELWTGQEPHAGVNYHALMLRLANPRETLRPPLPGGPDWEGDAPAELAPGWSDLMQRCWAEDPAARPTFPEIIQELRRMASAIKPRKDATARGQVPPVQPAEGQPPSEQPLPSNQAQAQQQARI